jgi:asparagine synthase (glutamine-hydrolysing)
MNYAARASGIYGLFRLDAGPIDRRDASVFGWASRGLPKSAIVEGFDSQSPGSVIRNDHGKSTFLLVGEIAEPENLAATLGVSAQTPLALIAQAALERYGTELPAIMLGEWSLLHWHAEGQLTVMMSAARRDRIFFAVSDSKVAIAPDLFCLGDLPWVGEKIDEAGLLFGLGRAPVRDATGDRTFYAGVRQIAPGECVVIDCGGIRRTQCETMLPPQPRFTGTFADAVNEAETLFVRIIGERLGRTKLTVPLLSGGLDSSLIAWAAARTLPEAQAPRFITSVAPPDSGVPDEAAFAHMVADTVGCPLDDVFPAAAANSYCPPEHVLRGGYGTLLSTRHCLTEAFQIAAKAMGATLLVNGTYGEMTMTAAHSVPSLEARLRRVAKGLLRHGLRGRGEGAPTTVSEVDGFHVRLSPHRLAILPDEIRAALAIPERSDESQDPTLMGYQPGGAKALVHPNEFYPGALRMDFPFRDVRLYRLFAGFPLKMLRENGPDRGIARQMLAGRVPDAIRLRTTGMPAFPDHLRRMQRQALSARNRIAAFRKAEVQEWLDLDWLDQALGRIAARGVSGYPEANEVQLTAITAEFLTWFRTRR